MSSRLTLAEARAQLYDVVTPDDANDSAFLRALNRVCEAFMSSGKWKGTKGVVTFASSSDGYIVLPRQYEAALGWQHDDRPRPIYNAFNEYLVGGIGNYDATLSDFNMMLDTAEEVPTLTAISTAGTIRLTRANSGDSAKTVRLYGKDADGNTVFDSSGDEGLTVTLSSATNDTAQVFSVITQVVKQVTTGRVTIGVVVDGTHTPLSVYDPTETVPLYRRYKIGVTDKAVRVLCKRRFVPLVDETDLVYPGNLLALRCGLIGDKWITQNDFDRAAASYGRAYQYLDNELKEARGGIRLKANIDPGPRVPNLY
jgi:hypothetical protein